MIYFFDNTINNIINLELNDKKRICALTRYEYTKGQELDSCEIFYRTINEQRKICSDSQDTWIYHTDKMPSDDIINQLDFCFGIRGCDNAFAYIMDNAGYECLNIPWTIKTYHYHTCGVRDHKTIEPVNRKYKSIKLTKF